MRAQPSAPVTLRAAAARLEAEAATSENRVLAEQVLGPIAQLITKVADDFDTYVADRLAEIRMLTDLLRAARPHVDADCDQVVERALTAGPSLRASELDSIADDVQYSLIRALEELESKDLAETRELRARIWQAQCGRS